MCSSLTVTTQKENACSLSSSCSPSSSTLLQLFQNIREFGAKQYSTEHRTANIIQLFVAMKGNFSVLFLF